MRYLAALVVTLGGAAMAGEGILPWQDPDAVAYGAMVYEAECATCHGARLEGQPDWKSRDAEGYLPAPPHDASGHTWHHPDAQLLDIVRRGTEAVVGQGYRSRMPGYKGKLTEYEMRAVLAYIKSTWPRRVIEIHDEINRNAGG
ncbi:MAG: cytochrome C [Alphaproteobacteria bacterium HGW-Alphaproteobacteria-1]|jgi:mono/diheme cytochrome c family protein|nr:MAG: cytochrome C [Alphaproteobacteria bacterium HGW-Alphaproteobacteria-1]